MPTAKHLQSVKKSFESERNSASTEDFKPLYLVPAQRPERPSFTELSVWAVCFVFAFAISYMIFGKTLVGFASFWPIASTLACAILLTWGVVRTDAYHGHLSSDHDLSGIQKSHEHPVPRIGGLSVYLSLWAAIGLMGVWGFSHEGSGVSAHLGLLKTLLLCALPAFLAGLYEDFTKTVSVKTRLMATFASAVAAAFFMGAVLPRLNVPGIDGLMALYPVAFVFTVFAVGGMSNAINIIDGFNGLASGSVVLVCLGFAGLAVGLGDAPMMMVCLTVAAAALGFMSMNYPRAFIFLGDGGAYFLGFLVAEVAVLMTARHAELSAWTVLTVIAYPVVEVVVSIVRRVRLKVSPGLPDRGHLHQLIQRWIVHTLSSPAPQMSKKINSQVSPIVWTMFLVNLGIAFACKTSILASFMGFLAAVGIYLVIYASAYAAARPDTPKSAHVG